MQEIIELPKNFELYRGTSNPNNFKRNDPVYFLYGANNGMKKAINLYTSTKIPDSNVFTFKTNRPVKLLNMGNPKVIRQLLSIFNHDKTIIAAFKKSFVLENNKVRRYSTKDADLIVAKAICLLDLDGYWTPKLPRTNSSSLFHQEIVLCNAKSKITPQNTNLRRPHKATPVQSIKPTRVVKFLNNNSNNNMIYNNNNNSNTNNND